MEPVLELGGDNLYALCFFKKEYSEEKIREVFSEFGDIIHLKKLDSGMNFIRYANLEEAQACLDKLGTDPEWRVRPTTQNYKRSDGGGRGGRGGGGGDQGGGRGQGFNRNFSGGGNFGNKSFNNNKGRRESGGFDDNKDGGGEQRYAAGGQRPKDANPHFDANKNWNKPVEAFNKAAPVNSAATVPVNYAATAPVNYTATAPVNSAATAPVNYTATAPVNSAATAPTVSLCQDDEMMALINAFDLEKIREMEILPLIETTVVVLGNYPPWAYQNDLYGLCAKGKPLKIDMRESTEQIILHYAYVHVRSKRDADLLIKDLDGKWIENRKLVCALSDTLLEESESI